MKKISTYLASVLLMLVVLSSCSSRPEDINVADLKEPCEFADAAVQCMNAIVEIVEGVDSPDELSEDDKKRIRDLAFKMQDIAETGRKRYDEDKLDDCIDKDQQKQLMDKVEPYLEAIF
jgi:hypothetical protein